MATTTETRLAAIGRQIDELSERAKTASASEKTRMQGQVEALRKEEAAARAVLGKTPEKAEAQVKKLETKLHIGKGR